jgi:hypothetical protein
MINWFKSNPGDVPGIAFFGIEIKMVKPSQENYNENE